MADVNNPSTADVAGETWADGDLPAVGGAMPTLLPAQDTFVIPANIAQCWHTVEMKDSRPGSPTNGQQVKRLQLKFDKNSPLVVADGAHKGDPFTMTINGNPRPRGKADDPATPWVSDLAYMLEIGLADKSRPKTAQALQAQINKYAGKTVRLYHGLTARCQADRVRYIIAIDPATQQERTVQDPSGQKGCNDDTKPRADGRGKQGRFYTRDFKNPDTNEYEDTIECDCGAVLRGFPSFENFLPPLGTTVAK